MISTLGRKCTNVQNVEIHLVENLHLLSYSGDKPHQCKERGKSFIKVGELKKHLRILTGVERMYLCPKYNYSSGHHYNLKRHKTKHSIAVE